MRPVGIMTLIEDDMPEVTVERADELASTALDRFLEENFGEIPEYRQVVHSFHKAPGECKEEECHMFKDGHSHRTITRD